MQDPTWTRAIAESADSGRAQAKFDQLKTLTLWKRLKKCSKEQARVLSQLFAGSQALTELFFSKSEWFDATLSTEALEHPRQRQGLERELSKIISTPLKGSDFSGALEALRTFKQREMLRIGARDLARISSMVETTLELSTLADLCLNQTGEICQRQLEARLGEPYHRDVNGKWQRTEFCVLGMGKLGGQELNYHSDVDLLFVYSEEGHVFKTPPRKKEAPGKGLSNHQFFNRLAEAFSSETSRFTDQGMLYRVDLRLRPEGNSGPLARAIASYENYYAQWGQTWERMMLIKTRPVAGSTAVGAEFLEMIQPFRYPRSIGDKTLEEIAATKKRLENEVVKAGEMKRNVKLGRGGIREIEFIVQSLQLLHGGRIPFIQEAQTLPALEKLAGYKLLAPDETQQLREAYIFLRNLEHRLQMENNQQTHTIPTERHARERLARLMGYATLREFESGQEKFSGQVRSLYENLFASTEKKSGETFPPFSEESEEEWTRLLSRHGFRDPARAIRLAQTFFRGPGYVHVSSRTQELAATLFRQFLLFCPEEKNQPVKESKAARSGKASPLQGQFLSDPDRVLARLDSFVEAYGTRAMLYETWHSNPSLFALILFLFDRSEFLAEIAIRTPDLVDSLALSGHLRRRKNSEEILKDLQHGHREPDQKNWIRRYHQSELMRIGLRDILGLADFEHNLYELSALAKAELQYGMSVIMRSNQLKRAPFAIVGFGKLGGEELNYGSDLDIIFVTPGEADAGTQKFAVELIDLLTAPTEFGTSFELDVRLRPDGEKGLLVNSLRAYEDYYRKRAQLWELQAVTRARAAAGDESTGKLFDEIALRLIVLFSQKTAQENSKTKPSTPSGNEALAGFLPGWKEEMVRMRARIETERTPYGKDHLAIKTGKGGLMDAEFIAQACCLDAGWQEPNTIRALERIVREAPSRIAGIEGLIENYRRLRRIEGILRRWSFASETLLPDDEAALYRVAVRCGYKNQELFMKFVGECRRKIRQVYLSYFSLATSKK